MLAERLRKEIRGEVLFDRFSRGRYATDASFYQIEPAGVVVPRGVADVQAAMRLAAEAGVPVLARGGGTSQCGQTVGNALVLDFSKYLNNLLDVDVERRTCAVEPGIALDELNRRLRPHGLWYPVDVSTSAQATIGGMAGNNSAGTRSLRYGIMRDRVLAIDGLMASGEAMRFDTLMNDGITPSPRSVLARELLDFAKANRPLIENAFPQVSRRVGGYNIDALLPKSALPNFATLLVGSEGTLAISTRLELSLAPLPKDKVLGICHFPTFRAAMEAAAHIVALEPVAVEAVDSTLIRLAMDTPLFRPTMEKFVRGEPAALLLVEFAEDDATENRRRLKRLGELMGDLGLPGSVVEVIAPAGQAEFWEVRKAGLNIMMSMRSDGKPVSFIEDCAVPLEHLADYTERLTDVFHKHGTEGTWYAHASVGCLHVRPVLNLKLDLDVKKMRAIAEEAFAMVREYKGSHSGEHGDGLVRSEFHESMYGRDVTALFEAVKDRFDPQGRLNPGKIVRPAKMDDRTLFRFKPDYAAAPMTAALDWSGYTGQGGGFQGAVEMCNNNGACRKLAGGGMCPSFRATRNEKDVTRGRANTLRLAISGQLGPDALASDEMLETVKLCVSCKACKRECPTGVDMAKMKIEVLAAARKRRRVPLRDLLVAYMPRYAPFAAWAPWLFNIRDTIPGAPWLTEKLLGFARQRPLPRWRSDPFRLTEPVGPENGKPVLLFGDTFNSAFEPDNLHAAVDVLVAAGYRVHPLKAPDGGRPPCCGRTFLAAGMVEEARAEARRFIAACDMVTNGDAVIVGLEPSCLLTLRDEFPSLLPGEATARLASRAFLLEEFLVKDGAALHFKQFTATVHLHGHCHQKAFGAMDTTLSLLRSVPGLTVKPVDSACCGMAGAFGYASDTYGVSMAMAELNLLPAVRNAGPEDSIVADGFSCRHQVKDGSGRTAVHAVKLLKQALQV